MTQPALAQRVVRGGLWIAASSYFNLAFGMAANLVLVHILVPGDFGVFALAVFFFTLINLRPKIGAGQALTQYQTLTGELIGSHCILDFVAGIVSLVITLCAVPILNMTLPRQSHPHDVVQVTLALALIALCESAAATPWILLDRELRFNATARVNSLVFMLSYVPAFWLARHQGRYWSLVAQNGTYAVLLLVVIWWTAWRELPDVRNLRWRFRLSTSLNLARFGSVVGLSSMAGLIVSQFDNFLVGTLAGATSLGYYDRAYRLAQWPSQLVTGVISRAAFYTYAQLRHDQERLTRTVTMSIWLITTLALPLAAAIFAAAPDLVRLVYGPAWLQSAVFVRFLVVYAVLGPLLGDANSLFTAVGRPGISAKITAVQAATIVVSGSVLTARFGVIGTCVAVGITFAVGLTATYYCVVRLVAVHIWSSIGFPVIVTALTLCGYLALEHAVDMNAWRLVVRVAFKLVVVPTVYVALTLALRRHDTTARMSYVWRLARGSR